jgi:hypothetical protein
MHGHIVHERGDLFVDDFGDAGTISRMRIELHRRDGLSAREAVPIEIAPESTQPYPIGLRDDLCGLSTCRPPARNRAG